MRELVERLRKHVGTAHVNETDAANEIERLQAIVAKLPGWADALVDAQNQLHGIRHTGMAKRNVRDVEEAIREAAEAVKGGE